MSKLFRIDAGARIDGSHSRRIANAIEAEWLGRHPGSSVLRRDIGSHPIPAISEETITGFFSPPESHTPTIRKALALSDILIGELLDADAVLIAAPMYNFSIPASLKAWIDQISRVGHTFSFDGSSFEGLVKGRPAYIACSYGASGYFGQAPLAGMNFLEPYLRGMLGFLGFTDISFFPFEGTSITDSETLAANHSAALGAIASNLAAA